MILSKNILSLLTRQYYHEISNHLFYSAYQVQAEFQGLTGFSEFLKSQAEGELLHAGKVKQFIIDRNSKLESGSPEQALTVDNWPLAFKAIQTREVKTTEMLNEILSQAMAEGDTFSFQWLIDPEGLIKEQIEEENIIQTILDHFAIRGDDTAAIHDLDTWIKGLV